MGTLGPELRTTRQPVEVRATSEGRRIGGYAAVFGKPSQNLGGFVEKVGHRFFNKSAGDGWPGVIARFDHLNTHLLGTTAAGTLQLRTDGTGLHYEVDVPYSREDVFELVSRGDVRASSFAFETFSDDWNYDNGVPLRTLISGRLLDVSPVVSPAYLDSTVGLRSLAAFVDAPLNDVIKHAQNNELRKFFVRTDPAPLPSQVAARAMTVAQARVQLINSRYGGGPPPVQRTPVELLDHLHRNRWPSYEVTPIEQQRSL